MNFKLASSGLLSAALLLGCSSAPKLPLPSGQWDEMKLPQLTSASSAAAYVPPRPAVTPVVPAPVIKPQQQASVPLPAPSASVAPAATAVTGVVASVATIATPVAPLNQLKTPAVSGKPVPAAVALPAEVDEVPTVAPTKSFPAAPAQPVVTVVAPVAKPVIPAPIPKQIWEARVGDSLRKVITNWSQRANYTLAWQAEDLDYPIDAPLHFEGSFEEAVASIFQLYDKADRSFIVDGRRAQHRLNVAEDRGNSKRAAP